jgi:hypothetical protein
MQIIEEHDSSTRYSQAYECTARSIESNERHDYNIKGAVQYKRAIATKGIITEDDRKLA